jgi:hypothetical protein
LPDDASAGGPSIGQTARADAADIKPDVARHLAAPECPGTSLDGVGQPRVGPRLRP